MPARNNFEKTLAFAPLRSLVFLVVAALMPGCVLAGGGPENVAVIVNVASRSSRLIANHYVAARNIPVRNVILLSDVPDREKVSFTDFRDKILVPVLQQLKARKIDPSIDYILYSADFPTVVLVREHQQKLFELVKKQLGTETMPNANLYGAAASITSATYFAAAVLADDPGYLLLDANNYFRKPASMILTTPFLGDHKKQYDRAIAAFPSGPGAEFDTALKTLENLAGSNPSQAAVSYWLARFYGRKGEAQQAAKWLADAVNKGWVYRDYTKDDKAFEKVRDQPLFAGLLQRMPNQPFRQTTSFGFRHQRLWAPNGLINDEPGQGQNLFLSTALAATRNYGTTEQEALDQVLVTAKADESRPDGTFYFSIAGGVRNTTRRAGIDPAIDALQALGRKAETIKTNLPKNKRDIVGLLTGTSGFQFEGTGNKILPGAICEHLTSHGGRLSAPGQTHLSEFIRFGAAGACGTVTEPYAIAAKFPDPMMHVHYARGCSLAESYYQSVHGPFQLLIVGDGLCQPWAVKPTVEVRGLQSDQIVNGPVSLELDFDDSPVPVAKVELYLDGVLAYRNRLLTKFEFNSAELSDGYHELRVVAIADDRVESCGNAVIPFAVNNKDQRVEIDCRRKHWKETEDVELTVKSNCGDKVQLSFRMELLEEKPLGKTGEVEFSVPAQLLGRGPVLLEAIARSDDSGLVVSSVPLSLQIDGPISRIKAQTERPAAKPPAKPRKASSR